MAGSRSPSRDWIDPALLVLSTLAVAVIVVRLEPVHPFIEANATGIVGAVFLIATWILVAARGEHPADYGLGIAGWAGEIGWAALFSAIVFPPFLIGFRIWWGTSGRPFDWDLPWPVWQIVATHLVVVALPEELLYRGFVQQSLGRALKGRIRVLGTQVGWAVPITAAVFALGHFATDLRPDRLATFFPALLFGWLKERRGGLIAAILFHAACNVLSDILAAGYLR